MLSNKDTQRHYTPTTSSDVSSNSSSNLSVPTIQNNPTFCIVQKPQQYSIQKPLNTRGYKVIEPISDALQGTVWKLTKHHDPTPIIAKIVNKSLHHKHIVYNNNRAINIKEDILQESAILQYLTNNHPPLSLIKFIDFFQDAFNYFLIMEHGGDSLFSFVKTCHQYIENGMLAVDKWRSFCTVAMQKIVSLIDWMHNTMHCCHLDISLENFVISDVNVSLDVNTKKILHFHEDFQIKIIDFGVAEVFAMNKYGGVDFSCTKYVGKTSYKAPEVIGKRDIFDARSADCWSVAVCFFMMSVGCPPFLKATRDDQLFCAIMNGRLAAILRSWNRMEYVDKVFVDLMNKMFVTEKYRLNIKEIQKHPYLL